MAKRENRERKGRLQLNGLGTLETDANGHGTNDGIPGLKRQVRVTGDTGTRVLIEHRDRDSEPWQELTAGDLAAIRARAGAAT
jgi:hypothetical protein